MVKVISAASSAVTCFAPPGRIRHVRHPAELPQRMSSIESPTKRVASGGMPQAVHAARAMAGSGLSGKEESRVRTGWNVSA
eukprot:CAMPEP_0181176224 /NCGR_PEP_ID=MMETSP1096-20121128/4512_1 /TAXON_ID=156174 ORGANISM="Chrysochromulina ericina, Strain CCMP281" /NCGR_SAMPLE_ID=MMETSP1096 /ASSEMBLY_ACC=CAM_ASM_000453 /LENGTH=80 /DNA_ID=CAMNT_0023264291 /DNA_START=512 /DNA_END=750 /DNA_ORIENTATION=+